MDKQTIMHRLGLESRIRLPNVDEILDTGYAFHAADDPSLEGTVAQQQAREIIAQFMSTTVKSDIERAYLSCAQSIALALGRAITRRKGKWQQELGAARQERERMLERIRESRSKNDGLTLAWRLLVPVILGITGYIAAQLIGDFVPGEVAEHTGQKLPSVLMGLVFIWVGRSAGFWWGELQRSAIELHYNNRVFRADMAYEIGKSEEHRYYRERLVEAWKEYTDEEYPATASYEMVMAGDIEARRKLEQHRQIMDRTTLWVIRRVARLLRGSKKLRDR